MLVFVGAEAGIGYALRVEACFREISRYLDGLPSGE
jgi:hypothetical protein